MAYGRSGRSGRGMAPSPRTGINPGSPRTGINPPGSQTGGAGACAGIANPMAKAQCMQQQEMNQQRQMQDQQMQQGNTGGPVPPAGPGRFNPQGPRGRMGSPRRIGRRGFGGGSRY